MHRQTVSFIFVIFMGVAISLTGCATPLKLNEKIELNDKDKLKAVLSPEKIKELASLQADIEHAYWLYGKTSKDKPFIDYFIDDYICPRYHIAPWAVEDIKEMLRARIEQYERP